MAPRRARWTLRLDPTACAGHGLCADLLPERIGRDEWGFPIIAADIPPGLAGQARRAVRACPVLALRLVHGTAAPAGRAGGRDDLAAGRRRPRERA